MKKQLLLITASLFTFISHAQTEKTDLESRQLRGRVKSVTETTFEVVEKFGEPEKGAAKKKEFTEYNSAGYETEYLLEDFKDGSKQRKWWKYEDKTRLVERKEESGNKISFVKAEYNPQGKMGTVDYTDDKGSLTNRQKYKYDADGLLIQTDTYNADGSRKFKIIRTYNGKKQLVKKEWFDEKGVSSLLETYAYDNNGNMIEETSLNTKVATALKSVRTYGYNDKKQKISENSSDVGDPDANLIDKTETFHYNTQGDLVRKSSVFNEETIVYTYDNNNNWIKAEKTSGGGEIMEILKQKPTKEIVERQIKYY